MAARVGSSSVWRFGVFEVDAQRGELRRSGVPLRVRDQSFQILVALLEHPGEVVTREELRHLLWPSDTFVDFDHSMNTAVMKLRDALGDSTEAPIYIETIPKHGYRFVAPVSFQDDASWIGPEREPAKTTTEGGAGTTGASEVRVGGSSGRRRQLIAAFVVACCCIASIVLGLNVAGLRDRFAATLGKSHKGAPPRIASIAVLPFQNLSGDPAQEYFADGMTEELITELGTVSRFRIISRTSVMPFKGGKSALPQIARALRADAIVEGTVTHSGNRIRITANLIAAATDEHLWGNTYDSDMEDVLAVRENVARSIASAIRTELAPSESRLTGARPRRVNPQAYQVYLEGRYHADKWTHDGFDKAEANLHESIDLDPTFAPAYSALAQLYGLEATWGVRPATEVFPAAEGAALKAVELDDGLAEAHGALGLVKLVYDWDWASAEAEEKRAVQLNASSEEAHIGYGLFLTAMGRHEEALREGRELVRLDPISPVSNLQLAWQLHWARQHDKAVSQIARVLELDPQFPWAYMELGWNYAEMRMYPEAMTNCRKALDLVPDNQVILGSCGRVYGMAGKRGEALVLLDRLQKLAKTEQVDPWHVALLYDGVGDIDHCVEYLQRAYSERSANLYLLKVATLSSGLRSDPRFQGLLNKLNFPS